MIGKTKTIIIIIFAAVCFQSLSCSSVPKPKAERQPSIEVSETDLITKIKFFGKLWGFLKFHHPVFTNGKADVDKYFLRKIGTFVVDPSSFHLAELSQNIDTKSNNQNENVEGNDKSRSLRSFFTVDFRWISESSFISESDKNYLKGLSSIPVSNQYYVGLEPGENNFKATNEIIYKNEDLEDWRYRVLGLFRFWNDVEYFYPYKKLSQNNWDKVLDKVIPLVLKAHTPTEFELALLEMTNKMDDAHAAVYFDELNHLFGEYILGAHLYFENSRVFVARVFNSENYLRPGDQILTIDGRPITKLIDDLTSQATGSNQLGINFSLTRLISRSNNEKAIVEVLRTGKNFTIETKRIPYADYWNSMSKSVPSIPTNTKSDVKYIYLPSLKKEKIFEYFSNLTDSKGIIIDLRGYPDFMVYDILPWLIDSAKNFYKISKADLSSPGRFDFFDGDPLLTRNPPVQKFKGKTIIIVDETTVSRAEFTAMAFQTLPNTITLGRQTAGSDGDVSFIPITDQIKIRITGLGIFYPDFGQCQRNGLRITKKVNYDSNSLSRGVDPLIEEAFKLAN